jgi:hypothetical protein
VGATVRVPPVGTVPAQSGWLGLLEAAQEVALVLDQLSVVDWGIVMLLADVEIATVAAGGVMLPQALRKEIPNKVSAHAKIFFTKPPRRQIILIRNSRRTLPVGRETTRQDPSQQ